VTIYGISTRVSVFDSSQFLPQDKVASFANITPTQLLRETQRAVGGEDMVNHWKRLINLRTEERDLQLVRPRRVPHPR
jgi:structural maintenance of chromosomes protein 5